MTSGQYILDDTGKPVQVDDILTWARWFATNKRHVAETELDGVRISTVFLGIDHNFGSSGAPVLWETMIFGGPHDGYQDRYTSVEAARTGHELAVHIARGNTAPNKERL